MLPTVEQAMWNCLSNEQWSAYKMERLGLITRAIPIKKNDQGEWVRDPRVITEQYIENGEIVYGESKPGSQFREGINILKGLKTDWSLLDGFIDKMVWTMANLMPLCLMKTVETIRVKKRYFWDRTKMDAAYWLGANMNTEAWLGFNAFNTEDVTGSRVIDFIKYRQLLAQGHSFDDELFEKVLFPPKPKE